MDAVQINYGKYKGVLIVVVMTLLIIFGYDVFCVVSTQNEIDSEFAVIIHFLEYLGFDSHFKFGTKEEKTSFERQ